MKSEQASEAPTDHNASEVVIDDVPVFEPGYQPEQLPKLDVPDLDANAQSLTAAELAQVPTLIDQVTQTSPSEASAEADTVSANPLQANESESSAQVLPVQADQLWEVFQVRMETLTTDIKKLNDRLDQLENRSKV